MPERIRVRVARKLPTNHGGVERARGQKIAGEARQADRLGHGLHPDIGPRRGKRIEPRLLLAQQHEGQLDPFPVAHAIPVAVDPAGAIQHPPGRGRIVAVLLDFGIIGPRAGEDRRVRQQALTIAQPVHQDLPVQRQQQRLAHGCFLEKGQVGVLLVEINQGVTGERRGKKLQVRLLVCLSDILRPDPTDGVDLAALGTPATGFGDRDRSGT